MKIVVRGTNWIGDSIMSVPALRALRQLFPDAEITLHIRSWAEGIFRDAAFIDRMITYDRPASGLNEVVEQARVLRAEKFDAALILPGSFASALTARFAGIPRRFGYSKDARRLFLTDPVTPPIWKNDRHEVYYYLHLVQEVEAALLGTRTDLDTEPTAAIDVSAARQNEARAFLAGRGVDLTKPVVAIGAGSTNSRAKRWPLERFATVMNRLQDEFSAQIVLMGSAGEAATSQEINALAGDRALDLTGKTSLADAAAIFTAVDLLISNDMGLAHVAPAVGTRTIVIFGPTDPLATRPFSTLAEVVRREVECSPCMLRDCPIDHRCMTRILPDDIFDRAQEILLSNDKLSITAAGGIRRS